MSEKLDLDALARLASGSLATGVDAIDPKDVLRLIGRIRELESQNREWLAANAPGGWIDDLRRELESASQPGGGEAEVSTVDQVMADCEAFESAMVAAGYNRPDLGKYIGMYRYQRDQDRYTGWKLARAAPSAGNGGAEGVLVASLLKHEATAAPSDTVSRRDVDELVAPTAVRANEVDPKVINSGLDGVKGDLDAAANASPHGGLRAEGSGLHDRQSATNIPATHDAENTALISADSAVNSQRGSQITATWSHDAGAYARCSYCGRYSDNPHSLTKDSFPCDCGKLHGWSGSFKKPGPDAKWSDAYLMPPNGKREAAR